MNLPKASEVFAEQALPVVGQPLAPGAPGRCALPVALLVGLISEPHKSKESPEQAPGHLIKPTMSAPHITSCRSLLAGDAQRTAFPIVPHRLQASSYKPEPEQAPAYRTQRE